MPASEQANQFKYLNEFSFVIIAIVRIYVHP